MKFWITINCLLLLACTKSDDIIPSQGKFDFGPTSSLIEISSSSTAENLSAVTDFSATAASSEAVIVDPNKFQPSAARIDKPQYVVGYYTWWSQTKPKNIPWDSYSHIAYAFLAPTKTGDFEVSKPARLNEVLALAKKHKTKIMVSLGGASSNAAFIPTASNPEYLANFVDTLTNFCVAKGIYGIDIDWEGFRASSQEPVTALFTALTAKAHERGLKVSAALPAKGNFGQYVSDEALASLDWLNIMIYDASQWGWSTAKSHSDIKFFNSSISYWHEYRGIPKNKLVLGVPFYGQAFGGINKIGYTATNAGITGSDGAPTYKDIWRKLLFSNYTLVEDGNQSYLYTEKTDGEIVFFDSPDILRRKSYQINQEEFLGIMVWAIGQDHNDSLSQAILEYIEPDFSE